MSRPRPAVRARALSPLGLGTLAAVLSAMAFAMNLTLVPYVYADGGNVHALNFLRTLVFALCMLGVLRLRRRRVLLPRHRRHASMLLGLLFCAQLYALLGAIAFLPVPVAMLAFHTYPAVVAVIVAATGGEPLSGARIAAIAAALAGLALVLGVAPVLPDWRGLGLAAVSPLLFGALVAASEPVMKGEDRRVVLLYFMGTSAAVSLAVALAGPGLVWPGGATGWVALAGSTLFFLASSFLLFTAVALIGPLPTAILDTSAPVWAVLFAWLLLGERLTGPQLAGAALTVAAIVFLQTRRRRLDVPRVQ